MNKKIIALGSLSALAIVALIGVSSASAQGMRGGWFGGEKPTTDEIAVRQTSMFEHKASVLGVSVDEVKSAWAEGKNMIELAEEKGISQEVLHEKMSALRLEEMKTNLEALVAKGVITQAQADQKLSFMQNNVKNMQGRENGMHKGMGMRGQGFGR